MRSAIRWTRLLTVVIAAAALSAGATVNPATARTAGACGWSVESWGGVGTTPVWDSRVNATTWLRFEIVTYTDGCGSKFYRLYEWDSTGTIAHLHLDIRVWICGVNQGIWTGDVWTSSGYLQTPVFWYAFCGRQADDLSSWIQSGWFSPTSGAAYVTS